MRHSWSIRISVVLLPLAALAAWSQQLSRRIRSGRHPDDCLEPIHSPAGRPGSSVVPAENGTARHRPAARQSHARAQLRGERNPGLELPRTESRHPCSGRTDAVRHRAADAG